MPNPELFFSASMHAVHRTARDISEITLLNLVHDMETGRVVEPATWVVGGAAMPSGPLQPLALVVAVAVAVAPMIALDQAEAMAGVHPSQPADLARDTRYR